jgi:hypothetical protein
VEHKDGALAGDISEITLSTCGAMGDFDGDCYTLELRADGTATGRGHRRQPSGARSEGRFTAEDFRQFAAVLEEAGFFSLDELYTNFRTCQASTSIEAVRDGRRKRVLCEGGVQPEVWPRLVAAFGRALEIADWDEA